MPSFSNSSLSNILSKGLFTTVVTGLIAYIFYRAYWLSFTYDECLSYTVLQGNEHIEKTANNHFLNTVLMFVTNALWGNSEFSLRLPNTLAFLMYLLFSVLLLRPARKKWIFFWLGFSLLLFNVFLLDFFSLARGYGLGMAFMLGSFYFIVQPIPTTTLAPAAFNKVLNKDILYSILLAFVATLANLSMINFLITVLLIGSIKHWWYATAKLLVWQYVVIGILALAMLGVNMNTLLFLKDAGELYHGTDNLNQTFTSVIYHCFYFSPYDDIAEVLFKMVCLGFWILGTVLVVVTKGRSTQLLISGAIFIILLLGVISEYILFGAKYPADRTALVFIITGSLFIYYTLLTLRDYGRIGRGIATSLALALSILVSYHFSVNANLEYCQVWKYDYGGKRMMQHIQQLTINHPEEQVSISNDWHFIPSILYYTERYHINMAYPSGGESPDNQTTFIYTWSSDAPKPNYTAIERFDAHGNTLFIRNDKIDVFYPKRRIHH